MHSRLLAPLSPASSSAPPPPRLSGDASTSGHTGPANQALVGLYPLPLRSAVGQQVLNCSLPSSSCFFAQCALERILNVYTKYVLNKIAMNTFRGVLLLSKIFYLNPLCLRIEPKKQTNVRQRSMQNNRQQAIDCDGSLCKRLFKVQSQTWHSNIQRGRCTHYWRNAILMKTVFACIYNVFV